MDEKRLGQESRAVLRFLKRWISVMGFAPTLEEIAQKSGITKNGAKHHLKRLHAAGLIERVPYTARGIRIRLIVKKRLRRKIESDGRTPTPPPADAA